MHDHSRLEPTHQNNRHLKHDDPGKFKTVEELFWIRLRVVMFFTLFAVDCEIVKKINARDLWKKIQPGNSVPIGLNVLFAHVCHRDAENTIAAQLVPGGAGYNAGGGHTKTGIFPLVERSARWPLL